jgi:hypothetical protein
VYGDRLFRCGESADSGTVTIRNHEPVAVVSIERTQGVQRWEPLGTHSPKYCWGYCSDYSAYFVAIDPLRVTLSLAPGSYQNTNRGVFSVADLPADMTGQCPSAYLDVADTWDFERLFTTTDPRVSHPGWNAKLIAPMLSFQAAPGMTAEMTAFALGFPSEFGTAAELLQQDVWHYYPGTDLRTDATFNAGTLIRIAPRDEFFFSADVY